MPSDRKFYKTEIKLIVLSEEPLGDIELDDLEGIVEQCVSGDYSGGVKSLTEEVDTKRIAKLLREQGSEPEFFAVDDDGEDTNN